MAFIHKNVNRGLMMLIAFISVALVTATVFSVEAFDGVNEAYAEQAMQVESLQAELAEAQIQKDSLKQAAALNQEREKALAVILEKQRKDAEEEQAKTQTIKVSSEPAKLTSEPASKRPYNPYRQKYFTNYLLQKRYIY